MRNANYQIDEKFKSSPKKKGWKIGFM